MLVNMGTLLAFVLVCAAVMVMRRTHPDVPRPFRVAWVPLVPLLGIASCLLLMFSLPAVNWLRLFVWLAIGLAIYGAYGRRRSHLAAARDPGQGHPVQPPQPVPASPVPASPGPTAPAPASPAPASPGPASEI
jgi:APA family basic amino acid/polyamine antiporter